MGRKIISPASEHILVRKPGFLPADLNRQETFPERLTIGTDIQLGMTQMHGYFDAMSQLILASRFGELRVAQGGSGFEAAERNAGTAPASYNTTNYLIRAAGYLRFDLTVETYPLDVQITFMNGSTLSDIKFPVGWYSIDANVSQIQVKYNGASPGTYQIIGWY